LGHCRRSYYAAVGGDSLFRNDAKLRLPNHRISADANHGTLSLYAALNVKTGSVERKTAPRHTSTEFVGFLTALLRKAKWAREIHIVLDNFAGAQNASGRAVPCRPSQNTASLHPNLFIVAGADFRSHPSHMPQAGHSFLHAPYSGSRRTALVSGLGTSVTALLNSSRYGLRSGYNVAIGCFGDHPPQALTLIHCERSNHPGRCRQRV
jgi:hypothetical protein